MMFDQDFAALLYPDELIGSAVKRFGKGAIFTSTTTATSSGPKHPDRRGPRAALGRGPAQLV
jgi:hypothetical protein